MASILISSGSIAILRRATREEEFAKTPWGFLEKERVWGWEP